MRILLTLIVTLFTANFASAQFGLIDSFELDNPTFYCPYHNTYSGYTLICAGNLSDYTFHVLGGETTKLSIPTSENSWIDLTSFTETSGFYTFYDHEDKIPYIYSQETKELKNLKTILGSSNRFVVRDNFLLELVENHLNVYDLSLNLVKAYSADETKPLLATLAKSQEIIIGNYVGITDFYARDNKIEAIITGDFKSSHESTLYLLEVSWDDMKQELSFSYSEPSQTKKIGKYLCSNANRYQAFRLNGFVQYTTPDNEYLMPGKLDFPFIQKFTNLDDSVNLELLDQNDYLSAKNHCEDITMHVLSTNGLSYFWSQNLTIIEPTTLHFKLPKKYKNKEATLKLQVKKFGESGWKNLNVSKRKIDGHANLANIKLDKPSIEYIENRLEIKIPGRKELIISITAL